MIAPVFLQISHDDGAKQAADQEQAKPGWQVDLTVPWRTRSGCEHRYADGQTDVKFWAASPQLAEQVTAGEEHLRRLCADQASSCKTWWCFRQNRQL